MGGQKLSKIVGHHLCTFPYQNLPSLFNLWTDNCAINLKKNNLYSCTFIIAGSHLRHLTHRDLEQSRSLYLVAFIFQIKTNSLVTLHHSSFIVPPPHFLSDQLTLSQPGGHIIPNQYYVPPPQIFRPCDGPAPPIDLHLVGFAVIWCITHRKFNLWRCLFI